MEALTPYLFLLHNLVVWAILGVGFFCYGLLVRFCFIQPHDNHWFELTQFWSQGLQHILTALPLLGLLGTVSGLMNVFNRMSTQGNINLEEMMTGGIGDALFTTQLGLVLVVPGLLLLGLLNHQRRTWLIRRGHEIIH